MSRQLEESQESAERTDEFPVLSEVALLDLATKDTDRLDQSVETLRHALRRAEQRWRGLESRLEAQDQAIAKLQTTLGGTETVVAKPLPVPQLTETVLPLDPPPKTAAAAESEFLERIASLEAYITGRADHWHAMEEKLQSQALRISELRSELEQRITREQNLEQQLQHAGDKSEGLRDELRRLKLQLRELRTD
jgi:septal ring factor EnvC (AmiA/AmiB activator)